MIGNLLKNLPDARTAEQFETLLARPGLVLQRIVSHGQASPAGFWYQQAWDEWVLLVQGQATLGFEDGPKHLAPGDTLLISAGQRHRVVATSQTAPTVWLALHFADEARLSPGV